MRLPAIPLLVLMLLQVVAPVAVQAQVGGGEVPPAQGNQGGTTPPVYVNMINFAGDRFVGVCYPWVVFTRNFLDLSSWAFTEGIGGDTALSVSCGGDSFVVVGMAGVYVVSRATGRLVDAVPLAGMRFIGHSGGLLAFLAGGGKVIVRTPFQGDMVMELRVGDGALRDIKFGAVSGFPFVAYIVATQSSVVLRYSTPARTVNVTTLSPASSALHIHDRFIIVENDGIEVYEVVDPSLPTIRKLPGYTLYLPFDIESFAKGDLMELYLYVAGQAVIKVDLLSRKWSFLGQGVVTDAGIFAFNPQNPELSTTYVAIRGTVYPIPGFAVARIGNLVFTNMPEAAVLYPAERSVLVALRSVDGVLQVTDDNGEVKAVRLKLAPGTYILPRGATISTDMGLILLDRDEVFYPPPLQEGPVIASSPVRYLVMDFPPSYQVVDEFEEVRHVASGGGKLLITLRDRAVVYAPYGVVTVIPGVWRWGGVSDHVVLYDGATLRVYDIAGNLRASYTTFVLEEPLHASVARTGKGYDVHLFFQGRHVVVNETGVYTIPDYPVPRKEDLATGLRVNLYAYPEVRYGLFNYRIPSADRVEVNMYTVAWVQGGTWYVLEVPLMTVYVFLNAPTAAIYPLGDYLAILANGTLRIVPFKSWIVGACYVDIVAPDFADIYVDGKPAGRGTLRYYAVCGRTINIVAVAEYHSPDNATVVVPPGGITVSLSPKPLVSLVRLHVVAPPGLPVTAIEAEVDGEKVDWAVGEAKPLVAEKPYNIRVLSFHPYDFCVHPEYTDVRFKRGEDALIIPCRLAGSVLGVRTDVPVEVSIYTDRGELLVLMQVHPGAPLFLPVQPGLYTLEGRPLVEKHVERRETAFVPESQLVVVDITPHPYGRLVVRAVPEVAQIRVMDENGTLVGEGVGEVSVDVPPGFYQVLAMAPGYLQHLEVVGVAAGEARTVEVVLVPAPPEAPAPAPEPIWRTRPFQLLVILVVLVAAVLVVLWRRRRAAREEFVEVEGGGG